MLHLLYCRLFQYNLLPKGMLSLKVLAELPLCVVLFYQLYKANVQKDLADFIPLILETIALNMPVK